MRISDFARRALGIGGAVALLSGCNGSQSLISQLVSTQRLAPPPSNPAGERVLYRFKGGRDGSRPYTALLDVNGTLLGQRQPGPSFRSKHQVRNTTFSTVTPKAVRAARGRWTLLTRTVSFTEQRRPAETPASAAVVSTVAGRSSRWIRPVAHTASSIALRVRPTGLTQVRRFST